MPLILLLTIAVVFLILKLTSAKIKGAAGEAKVNARLHFLGAEYISLHDVLLPNGRGRHRRLTTSCCRSTESS